MRYDTRALKERVNLIELAGQSTRLRKKTATEWEGPCPRCGGTNRFTVKADWWFCRQCYPSDNGLDHDAIAYIQWRDGVDFKEACEALGGAQTALECPVSQHTPRFAEKPTLEAPVEAPGALWQERARSFAAYCAAQLWERPEALDYLRGRGLHDATIEAAQLGYNPAAPEYVPAAHWGLEGKGVWLPAGWVIPCEIGGQLQYVKVRRLDADIEAARAWNAAHPKAKRMKPQAKYHAVKGGPTSGVLYGLDDLRGHTDAILCEGELDALLLRQQLAGVAGVASLPGVSGRPGTDALGVLVTVRRVWVVFDTDEPGEKARARWDALSARVRPLIPPAHDVTDAYLAGHDVAAWAIGQIGPTAPERRMAWARWHLDRLQGDGSPAYVALTAELERLEASEPAETCADDGDTPYPPDLTDDELAYVRMAEELDL